MDEERAPKLPRITIHDNGDGSFDRNKGRGSSFKNDIISCSCKLPHDTLETVTKTSANSNDLDSDSDSNFEFKFKRNKNSYFKDNEIKQATLSNSSRRLLEANEEYERELWRAARNYQQLEHYDYSLFGLDLNLDQAVGLHQREAMLYNQGEFRCTKIGQLIARVGPITHYPSIFISIIISCICLL